MKTTLKLSVLEQTTDYPYGLLTTSGSKQGKIRLPGMYVKVDLPNFEGYP